MKAIQLKEKYASVTERKVKIQSRPGLIARYMEYCNAQHKEKIYWFMKAIIIIPCVIMVPSIFMMHEATDNYVWFVGLSMALFFANLMVHIADRKSKEFVPVYHLSILIMILIPAIYHLINLL